MKPQIRELMEHFDNTLDKREALVWQFFETILGNKIAENSEKLVDEPQSFESKYAPLNSFLLFTSGFSFRQSRWYERWI